jgi:hypothetical protein
VSFITYKDCPECGARKIHDSVSLCEVCEISQRYETRLEQLRAMLDLANAMHDVAVKERDLAHYQLANAAQKATKPAVHVAEAGSKSVWERRLETEKAERAERVACLAVLAEKYRATYDALRAECAQTPEGHQWSFSHWDMGGDSEVYYCNFCRARKIDEV